MPDAYILGIESSCDETGAAVVRSGDQILSNVVASQIATHQPYGGVVPELASREHLKAMVPVVRQALAEAGHTYQSVDAIAVTQGPGLAGALLVGISFAKALAFGLEKPLIAVNHLEGHIHAVLLEHRQSGQGGMVSCIFRYWLWWFRVDTRTFISRSCMRIFGLTGTSDTRATTRRARLSIRLRSFWGWVIPEDR
jgi:N6-L-threonylcarbamoyladenine synthase